MARAVDPAAAREALSHIVEGELSSVQFVMDYLILGFEPRGAVTSLIWPEIVSGETITTFGSPGYRDQLCELIEQVVRSAGLKAEEMIEIEFANGTLLRIPLATYDRPGERLIIRGPKHYLFVC